MCGQVGQVAWRKASVTGEVAQSTPPDSTSARPAAFIGIRSPAFTPLIGLTPSSPRFACVNVVPMDRPAEPQTLRELPSYWMPRPAPDGTDGEADRFDTLFRHATAAGPDHPIDYRLPDPKWRFLSYVADTGQVVLHGSGAPDIQEFEPCQSDDVREFGNRRAVYAASDGVWPMFFAIVDRERFPRMSINNACIRVPDPSGAPSRPYYFFSIDGATHRQAPWRRGTVYLLPAGTFEQDVIDHPDVPIESAQAASREPVTPLAKLVVEPEDFPFLQAIRVHDPDVVIARAAADPNGFPWLDES